MTTFFVLENLDNLRKNGRLTKTQPLGTGALRVKLLMGTNGEGEIIKLGQGLSIRQTLARMVARMAENGGHSGGQLVLAHCSCPERTEYGRDLIQQKFRFDEIVVVQTGGITTVYANDRGIVAVY